jgi:hypothetical protein
MINMIIYPSTNVFRNVIQEVSKSTYFKGVDENGEAMYYDRHEVTLPKIVFKGTVKIHGTQGAIAYNDTDGYWAQSRKNIVTIDNDNYGFSFFVHSLGNDVLDKLFKKSKTLVDTSQNSIVLYGEFFGSNIQKGVAVTGLDKMFAIFGVKVKPFDENIESYWLNFDDCDISSDVHPKVFNIETFGTYELEIDFEDPKGSQNKLIELTEEVEKECPVGAYFGRKLGIDNTVGEGIVWSSYFLDKNGNSTILRFKVKGEKHSSSKVKKLASVDVEKLNNIKEFVEYAVTENRLNQGINELFLSKNIEIDRTKIRDFVIWVKNDVIKEEMDTLVSNNLEIRDVVGGLSKKSASWLIEYMDKQIFGE